MLIHQLQVAPAYPIAGSILLRLQSFRWNVSYVNCNIGKTMTLSTYEFILYNCLVVWNMFGIFPYVENSISSQLTNSYISQGFNLIFTVVVNVPKSCTLMLGFLHHMSRWHGIGNGKMGLKPPTMAGLWHCFNHITNLFNIYPSFTIIFP